MLRKCDKEFIQLTVTLRMFVHSFTMSGSDYREQGLPLHAHGHVCN